MKNDIDSILDALFSGGKLNVGSGTKSRAAKDAEDFLNSIEKTNANMQSSLNRQISDLDKLTSDAQRSMDEMRRLLDAEGLTGTPEMEAPKAEAAEKKPKAKGAEEPPQDPAQSFREAREATGRTVIGQDAFLDSLFTAFRRPSVTGRENGKPRGGRRDLRQRGHRQAQCACGFGCGALQRGRFEKRRGHEYRSFPLPERRRW